MKSNTADMFRRVIDQVRRERERERERERAVILRVMHSVRGETIVILSVQNVRSRDIQNSLLQKGMKTGKK